MRKLKTTFIALISLVATFAMALSMLALPVKGSANATATAQTYAATDMFSFADAPVAGANTGIKVADTTNLPEHLVDPDGNFATNVHAGTASHYDSYDHKGLLVTLTKSNVNGAPLLDEHNVPNVNNVVRTKTFSLKDNTKDDILFGFMPATARSYVPGTTPEDPHDQPNPTSRNAWIRIVDAEDPTNYLAVKFERRTGEGTANVNFANMRLYTDGNYNSNIKIVRDSGVEYDNALVPDVAWQKYNTIAAIYYDAAENALYADLTTASNAAHIRGKVRDFDTAYSDNHTFDFDNVYLEFYYGADGGGTSKQLITHVDGLSLETDADGNLLPANVAEYSKAQENYVTPALSATTSDFTEIGEYDVPRVLGKANMIGVIDEQPISYAKQFYVTVTDARGEDVTADTVTGLTADGRWTENAKFTPVHDGGYTITYTMGTNVVTLNVSIAKAQTLTNLITTSKGVTVTPDKFAPDFMKSGDCANAGVGIKWDSESTITIEKEFSVGLFNLEMPIVEYAVTPSKKSTYVGESTPSSEYEFEKLELVLVDSENEDIYIRFVDNATRFAHNLSFVTVAANNQVEGNDKDHSNGGFKAYSSNNGVATQWSFTGVSNRTAKFYYDAATQQTATGPTSYKNSVPLGNQRYMMRDLDFEDHLLAGDVPFAGFPSGKVKLEIRLSAPLGEKAEMIIYSVMGQKLNSEEIKDVTPPTITDVDDFDNVKPQAQIGTNFPFPAVSAYDVMSGDRTSQITGKLVDPNGQPVAISGNGFTPTKIGNYKYTVSVMDEKDNETTKEFTITVSKKLTSLYIQLTDVEGKAYKYPTTSTVGQAIKTPQVKFGGGTGNKKLTFNVYAPDGSAVDTSESNIEFTKQGLYRYVYEVVDYLGVPKVFEYSTLVTYSTTPVIGEVSMPVAILSGQEFTLPAPEAYDYYSYLGEKRAANVEIKVTEPGKSPVVLDNTRKFTPTITDGQIKIEYTAKALLDVSAVSEPKTYYLDVVKPQKIAEYFIMENMNEITYEKLSQYGNAEALYSTSNEGATMSFINPLPAIGFGISLVSVQSTELQEVDFFLTDVTNPDQKVKVTVTANDMTSLVSVNGGEVKEGSGSFAANRTFTLTLKNGYKLCDARNYTVGTITNTVYGEPFSGFDSGKVYLQMVFKKVGPGGAKFAVRQLVNQARFDGEALDKTSPFITLEKSYQLYHNYGATITINRAFAADIIDPNPTLTLSVTAPDGTKVLNNVVPDVERALKLEQYGEYVVEYKAVDDAGKVMTQSYKIVAYDDVKPVLEINSGDMKTTYKVGEKLDVYQVEVSDNYTVADPDDDSNLRVYVMITELYTSKITTYKHSELYGTAKHKDHYFTMAGTYKVKYYVRDEFANFTQKEFTITVTE